MAKTKTGRYSKTKDTTTSDTSSSSSAKNNLDSQWRTYSTSTSHFAMPEVVSRTGFSFLSMAFMMYADLNLDSILSRSDCISTENHDLYIVYQFRLLKPMTLVEFDKIIDKINGLEQVFTWIPTMAVLMGRRVCYSSSTKCHPYFKINAVTDDDGKFGSIQVTVFDNQNRLRQDLNKEIAFYLKHKGYFRSNTDILDHFSGLILPPDV